MTSTDLYQKVARFQLSEFRLMRHSYPRPHPSIKGNAQISIANAQDKYTQVPSESSRKCRRCYVVYPIHTDGKARNKSKCSYHPYRKPNPGRSYRCCGASHMGMACKNASQHVHGDFEDLKNLSNFMYTKDNVNVSTKEIYALDCEMIYTDGGMEVAAISIVDSKCNVVYETKIIPDHDIVDYNTEFSGLKATNFEGVTTTMKDVHTKFESLFGPETILIGHGLASDLLRLRVIHDRIVDTLEVYPHKSGYPFLNGLQYLKDNFLSARNNSASDFKCREDAISTMRLVLLKA